MQSNIAVTYQIDDLEIAAQELADGIMESFTLLKNTVGILFCYSDMDIKGLAAILNKKLDFDFIGCTAIASMDQKEGFHEMAATLTVLTADDCEITALLSDVITKDQVKPVIKAVLDDAKAILSDEPKLLYVLPPYRLEVILDDYTAAFNQLMPGVPIVGGLPSNNTNGDYNLTIFNGNTYEDRLVMLAVTGNIRPVSSVQHVGVNTVVRKRKVTMAKGNTVYKVGDQIFTDYLREVGLPVEKLAEGTNTITFVSNPLLLENTQADDPDFSFLRTLHEIDLEKGSGTAVGMIPKDATISICALKRDEIEIAAARAITDIKAKMAAEEAEGYKYSTILAISCIGRYLLMLPHGEVEVSQILTGLPPDYTLSGFYSYGEIGPYGSNQNVSFAHNESLVLCAF